MLGTVAMYFRQPRSPLKRDFELMARLTALASIAIERKRAEEALRRSESRYRGLFENVIEGVYRSSFQGRFEEVNPALVEMLGYERAEDVLALTLATEYYARPEDRAAIVEQLQRDGFVQHAEYEARRRDGSLITVVENARVVRDAHGEVVGFEGTIADITTRKRAELQLAAEKEKAQVTLQSIGDAVITANADGHIEYLNPVAEQLTGWESAAAAGRPAAEVVQLVSESGRQPIENPIVRCLREGHVVEMLEHTVLINRRGVEI